MRRAVDKRPGLNAMMKAVNEKQFDLVAAWSVDRLGRSLTQLLDLLQALQDKGVDLFLHQQGLDTPARRCFRCARYLPCSSAGLFGRGSTQDSRAPRRTGPSLAGVVSSPLLRLELLN